MVETGRVQLAEGERIRIGKVDDRRIVEIVRLTEPDHRVLVDHVQTAVGKRMSVQLSERRKHAREGCHFSIEIDERHLLDAVVLQDLSQRQAIAAPQNEDAARLHSGRHRRMHESLVVAIFVG